MKPQKRVVYCIIPREDFAGVFYTIDTVTPGESNSSSPFDQKPTLEQLEDYLLSVYPRAEGFTWCSNHSLTAEEIAARFF